MNQLILLLRAPQAKIDHFSFMNSKIIIEGLI